MPMPLKSRLNKETKKLQTSPATKPNRQGDGKQSWVQRIKLSSNKKMNGFVKPAAAPTFSAAQTFGPQDFQSCRVRTVHTKSLPDLKQGFKRCGSLNVVWSRKRMRTEMRSDDEKQMIPQVKIKMDI